MLKSDRSGRALIAALWIMPVVLPFVAAGGVAVLRQTEPAPAQAAEAPPNLRPAQAAQRVVRVDEPAPAPSIPVLPGDGLLKGAAPILPTARLQVAAPPPPAPAAKATRIAGVHVLRNVTPLEGLRLGADGLVIALAGVSPPPAGAECRRLDGVMESCAQRAMARLEILTRGRPVTCDLRDEGRGDPRGVCRAGKIDLSDDLIRNKLAVRAAL